MIDKSKTYERHCSYCRFTNADITNITGERALVMLVDCERLDDESAHVHVDAILSALLVKAGYGKVVDMVDNLDVSFWYA